jgi:hypothetical protein
MLLARAVHRLHCKQFAIQGRAENNSAFTERACIEVRTHFNLDIVRFFQPSHLYRQVPFDCVGIFLFVP